MKKRGPETYWLHVQDGNSEQRFETEPTDLPTLRVIAAPDGGEITFTRNIILNGALTPVHPRGNGWTAADTDADPYSTVWYRTPVLP